MSIVNDARWKRCNNLCQPPAAHEVTLDIDIKKKTVSTCRIITIYLFPSGNITIKSAERSHGQQTINHHAPATRWAPLIWKKKKKKIIRSLGFTFVTLLCVIHAHVAYTIELYRWLGKIGKQLTAGQDTGLVSLTYYFVFSVYPARNMTTRNIPRFQRLASHYSGGR